MIKPVLLATFLLLSCQSDRPFSRFSEFEPDRALTSKPVVKGLAAYEMEVVGCVLEFPEDSDANPRIEHVLDLLNIRNSKEYNVSQNFLSQLKGHWPGVTSFKRVKLNVTTDSKASQYGLQQSVPLDSDVLKMHIKKIPPLLASGKVKTKGKNRNESWETFFQRKYRKLGEKRSFLIGTTVRVTMNRKLVANVELSVNKLVDWESVSWVQCPWPVIKNQYSLVTIPFQTYDRWRVFGISRLRQGDMARYLIVAARLVE